MDVLLKLPGALVMKYYQIKSAEKGAKPARWYRLLVPSGITFTQLYLLLSYVHGEYPAISQAYYYETVKRDIQIEEGETVAQYNTRLYARGVEKLLEQQKTWECAILPLAKEFGSKYDLGDILTIVLNEYNLVLQARVSRFTQKQQRNQLETIVEIGNITIR
jgi:hypothetical protein